MHFHDLAEDVLAQILVSCDIYTVLSFLRVNKSLRRVALSKQLWISLVLDLSLRYFIPDLNPIHGHTTAQLIAKVKLSIVQVDLTTGRSDEVFCLDLNMDTASYYSPILSGNLLAVRLQRYLRPVSILVIDWREAVYVIFESPAQPDSEVAFVPGHLILTPPTLDPWHDRLIFVYALRSIASHWRPATELALQNANVPHIRLPEDMSPVIVERLEDNNRARRDQLRLDVIAMMVHTNPIRDNVYKLVFYATEVGGAGLRRNMLFTYQLTLGDPGPSWTTTSVISLPIDLPPDLSWAYAGYGIRYPHSQTDCTRIVDPRPIPGFIQKLAGPTVREVVAVCEGSPSTETRLSSTGIIFARLEDRVEILCYL
ncbi:hypothetical protein B0H12DRAFT_1241836 [Mycena haematopus]|nr:hypothetical protein B0H12DRAFT_1241836 [Mycena haematopus]